MEFLFIAICLIFVIAFLAICSGIKRVWFKRRSEEEALCSRQEPLQSTAVYGIPYAITVLPQQCQSQRDLTQPSNVNHSQNTAPSIYAISGFNPDSFQMVDERHFHPVSVPEAPPSYSCILKESAKVKSPEVDPPSYSEAIQQGQISSTNTRP